MIFKKRFKKVFTFIFSFVIILLSIVPYCFASTDVTLFNIYDTSNSNNVIGYYSIHEINNSNVYDLDNVYIFTTNGVIENALRTFNNDYISTNDIDFAIDSTQAYINNNTSIESTSQLGQGAISLVRSWLLGYVVSLSRNVYLSNMNEIINYRDNYSTAISNAYSNGYNVGYNEGLTENNNISYDNGFNDGYSAGRTDAGTSGYNAGYTDGTTDSNGAWKFIYALFTAPFIFIGNLFSFKLFGIDFYQIILSILSFVLIFFVLRFILSRIG